MNKEFTCHQLDSDHALYRGRLPGDLTDAVVIDELWNLHPPAFPEIQIHGRLVKTPRWQQTYGRDYYFSGLNYAAKPTPPILAPISLWVQSAIDARLNGILLNWYDGALGHYIGAHRDSIKGMVPEAPIVTVSFGEERVFRMGPWKGSGMIDFFVDNGSVIVLPYTTNLLWTHEVTRRVGDQGRRISVTFRAFS